MSILNLEFNAGSGGRAPRNKRAVKVWVGIGLVAAVLGVGSTLASTITLNNGGATEFGQGISTTIYCGGAQQTVHVTPVSVFDNSDPIPAQAFYVGQIKVTGIPSACAGVDFAVSIFDNASTPNALPMSAEMSTALTSGVSTAGIANVWFPDGCPTVANTKLLCADQNPGPIPATGAMVWFDTASGPIAMDGGNSMHVRVTPDHSVPNAGSFTLTLPYPWLIKASDVSKIVIETKEDVNGYNIWANSPVPGPDPLTH
jgi:hypothetical protein